MEIGNSLREKLGNLVRSSDWFFKKSVNTWNLASYEIRSNAMDLTWRQVDGSVWFSLSDSIIKLRRNLR